MVKELVKFKDVPVQPDGRIIQVFVRKLLSKQDTPSSRDNSTEEKGIDLDSFFDNSKVRKLEKF